MLRIYLPLSLDLPIVISGFTYHHLQIYLMSSCIFGVGLFWLWFLLGLGPFWTLLFKMSLVAGPFWLVPFGSVPFSFNSQCYYMMAKYVSIFNRTYFNNPRPYYLVLVNE